MCPEPAVSSDRKAASGLPDEALPAGLLEALRSGSGSDTGAAARRRQVARARRRVEHVRLDDAELIQGIATSLLAASARTDPTTA